jgi:hypothetical protein
MILSNLNFRKIVGYYSQDKPALDPTTAWFEWNSYCECCKSLSIQGQPNINRYMRYRNYLKEVGVL